MTGSTLLAVDEESASRSYIAAILQKEGRRLRGRTAVH